MRRISRKRRLRYNFPFVINCFLRRIQADAAPLPTMPIYEYRCASCGHELEVLQKLSDAPLTQCPACHRAALQKKVSAAGFQLKGSGWYVTDFRNKDAKKPAKDAAKPADKPNGAEATSDAKAPASPSSETTKSESKAGGASEAKSTTASDKSG